MFPYVSPIVRVPQNGNAFPVATFEVATGRGDDRVPDGVARQLCREVMDIDFGAADRLWKIESDAMGDVYARRPRAFERHFPHPPLIGCRPRRALIRSKRSVVLKPSTL